MHIVAIDRVPAELSGLIPVLAHGTGKSNYEARSRLLAGQTGPAVIAAFADPEAADRLAAMLEELGLVTARFDTERLARHDLDSAMRSFELGSRALALTEPSSPAREIPFAEVTLLLRATRVRHTIEKKKASRQQLALGRALATGGLLSTRTVTTQRTSTTTHSEELLLIYTGPREPVALYESQLRYQGLKDAMQPSRTANFAYLCSELRRRAPAATWDDRLLRYHVQSRILGASLDPSEQFELVASLVSQSIATSSHIGPFRTPSA
jgi:hypothetical protein